MRFRASVAAFAVVFFAAPSARAELVFFSSGQMMSVKGHRIEDSQMVLLPRGGGEMSIDASLIARIEPDEVPYPEPETDAVARIAPQAAAVDFGGPHQYDLIIDKTSAEQGVDAKLVRAVIQVESNYQEHARSPKGAMGLMQLMPDTARQYAVSDPYDPAASEAG